MNTSRYEHWARAALGMAALLMSGACHDVNSPMPPQEGRESLAAGALPDTNGGGTLAHDGALPRFSIELTLEGPARLGSPVRIEAVFTGLVATAEAGLSIALPELAVSRTDGWLTGSARVFPLGVGLVPASRLVTPIARGESIRRGVDIVFTEPGYYQIVATANQRSAESPIQEGRAVQGFVAEEMFLLVDDSGARLTRIFDAMLLPPDVHRAPGPFRPRSGAQSGELMLVTCEDDPSQPICLDPEPPPPAPPTPAYFRAVYGDPAWDGSYVYRGLPQALVTWQTPSGTFTTRTDDDGGYVISPCPTGTQRYIVSITYQHPDVMIAHPFGVTYEAIRFDFGREGCNQFQDHVAIDRKSHIWANMITVIPASRRVFGQRRGPIAVYYDPDTQAPSFYNPSADLISIGYSDVLGDRGRFAAAHEYGHALHEKALGSDHGGNCPSPHYFDGESGLRCAFSEGFANYHSAATLGEATGVYYDLTETPIPFRDGALAELAVAAFLFDLTDPPNEVHDVVQYPGSYVAGLIRDCDRRTFLAWSGADGIDVIIYCAELAAHIGIDPLTRSRLPARSPAIAQVREQQTEPGGPTQKADVSRLWRWNLYGERP